MLKRLISLFISLFVLFNVAGCKENMNDKILLEGNMDNVLLVELEADELQEKIENKEDFMLVIKLEGCSSCEAFNNDVLKPFIKETHAVIYSIYAHKLDAAPKYDNKPKYKLAPNFQIYKQGKSIVSVNYDTSKKYFTNLDEFKSFISKYVIYPKIIEVSEETLDSYIKQGKSFILYIGWSKCGDCALVYDNVLKEYLINKQSNQTILYLEVDEYRRNKPSSMPVIDENSTPEDILHYENYMKWLTFANKYEFAFYRDGKVPTFHYYENGKVKSSIVYKNDYIAENVIVNSFYRELIGRVYDQESLDKYHNDKVIEFFDRYYI